AAGVESEQPYLLQGFFDVPADDTYQFQLWHDGEVKLSVDGVALYENKQGDQVQRFIAAALGAGRHRLSVSGKHGNGGLLKILFGGPGVHSIDGKNFRHAK